MLNFLAENISTIIVAVIVAAIMGFIVYKMIKEKKQGGGSCGCGCKDCANASMCHGNANSR